MEHIHTERQVAAELASNQRIRVDLLQTVETLRQVTNSQNMELYLVDWTTKELFRCPRVDSEAYRAVRYEIGPGSVMAAYVAWTRLPIICKDVVKMSCFPLGVDRLGSTAKHGLCVPILSRRMWVLGVMELTKDKGSQGYTLLELEMCTNLCQWMIPSIEEYLKEHNLMKETAAYSYLIENMISCVCGHNTHENAFAEQLRIAGVMLNSETFAFYVKFSPNEEDNSLRKVKMYVPSNDLLVRKTCFNVQEKKCLASIAMLGKRVEIASVNDLDRFHVRHHDPLPVRSAIAAPLILNGSVKGCVEYLNSMDSDRFYVEHRIKLFCLTALIEFNFFVGALTNRTRKTRLHLVIDDEKIHRAMEFCRSGVLLIEESRLRMEMENENRLHVPTDDMIFLSSMEKMFSEVLEKWKSYDTYKRFRFLKNIFNFALDSSPTVLKKIWCSVEFLHDILSTYLPYFSETEKELMMYTTLCRLISNPLCGLQCIPNEVSIQKTSPFDECNTFYFVRTVFEKSDLFEEDYLESLMRKLKVTLHTVNFFGVKGIKENLFKLIARKELDLSCFKHRMWLRKFILSLADQAMYFRPNLVPFDRMVEVVHNLHSFYEEYNDVDMTERRTADVIKVMTTHLKLNVLPHLLLLMAILPETKIYLIYCLQALNSLKAPRRKSYRATTDKLGENS